MSNTNSNTNDATVESNVRPEYDNEIQKIADYVLNYSIDEQSPNPTDAWNTARHCLMDTLGCGLLALRFPECTKHLGPDCPDQITPHGARVPGTSYRLDPIKAAFDIHGIGIALMQYKTPDRFDRQGIRGPELCFRGLEFPQQGNPFPVIGAL